MLFPDISGVNSDIVYSLLDSADGFFSIDEQTGVISLERPLDRELQATYELRALASDQGSPRFSSVCQVVISVLDINDNPPVFEHREYTATVSEDVTVGTQLLRVQAASRDTEANGEISYGIISGNEHGLFSVDPRTGMLVLEGVEVDKRALHVSPATRLSSGDVFVIEPLDYEASHEYYITIEATDGGSPPLSDMATVNINLTDVNDNRPVFSQDVYTAVVSEDTELGRTVVTVRARAPGHPRDIHISTFSLLSRGPAPSLRHYLLRITHRFHLSHICTCGKSPSGGRAKLGPALFIHIAAPSSCVICHTCSHSLIERPLIH